MNRKERRAHKAAQWEANKLARSLSDTKDGDADSMSSSLSSSTPTAALAAATAARARIVGTTEQIVHLCAEHKKPKKLIKFVQKIRKEEAERPGPQRLPALMLVFCNRIKTALYVKDLLYKAGFKKCATLHGQMKQDKRELVLGNFRAAKTQMLIATDVAARGLDIKQLPIVINWDMPPSIEQYVHRIGRAARHEGNRGIAFTFFTRHYANLAPDMVKLLQSAGQAVDPNMKSAAREYIALQGEAKSAASGEVRSDDEIADVPNSYSGVASLATSCSKPVWTSSEEEEEEEEEQNASAEDGSDKFGRSRMTEKRMARLPIDSIEGAKAARLVLVLQV